MKKGVNNYQMNTIWNLSGTKSCLLYADKLSLIRQYHASNHKSEKQNNAEEIHFTRYIP